MLWLTILTVNITIITYTRITIIITRITITLTGMGTTIIIIPGIISVITAECTAAGAAIMTDTEKNKFRERRGAPLSFQLFVRHSFDLSILR